MMPIRKTMPVLATSRYGLFLCFPLDFAEAKTAVKILSKHFYWNNTTISPRVCKLSLSEIREIDIVQPMKYINCFLPFVCVIDCYYPTGLLHPQTGLKLEK